MNITPPSPCILGKMPWHIKLRAKIALAILGRDIAYLYNVSMKDGKIFTRCNYLILQKAIDFKIDASQMGQGHGLTCHIDDLPEGTVIEDEK